VTNHFDIPLKIVFSASAAVSVSLSLTAFWICSR